MGRDRKRMLWTVVATALATAVFALLAMNFSRRS